MTSWYKATEGRIKGRRTIKHSSTGEECLVGRYGEIWEVKKGLYGAVVTSARVANKYLPTKIKDGEETLVRFTESDFETWCDRLGIFKHRSLMIKKANNFGKKEN